jgi:aldehyde dehydrogenase (NAD+)
VSLELGGKSAAIVLDDADLASMADEFLWATMCNNGQTCWLSTRIFVPRQRYAELADTITDIVKTQVVGPAMDEATDIGPMTSSTHRDRVEGYIMAGFDQGGRVTMGGGRPLSQDRGWFVDPTIFVNVDNTSIVAQEEIFGPVLCVIPYGDVDDAIAMANDSKYGLGGTVWTADDQRGLDVAYRVHTGTIGINGYRGNLAAPFGGVKGSGFGREMGQEGLSNYQSLKSVHPRPGSSWPQ